MPTPPTPASLLQQAVDALQAHDGNVSAAARSLDLDRSTFKARLARAERLQLAPPKVAKGLEVAPAPDSSEPLPDLIERKRRHYERSQAADAFHRLVPVRVRDSGPVCIVAIGDPHLDDDGCDIAAVERDMTIIGRTEGMHALHLGDITNNWVGRLGRLYAHQSTTASDGIRLAEWMFGLAPPLAVVAGNHDLWNEGMSWLNFVVKRSGCATIQPHGVRMELKFPRGQAVRIHARHDFPGHSQYSPVHGLRREALFGQRDHITIAGHKHVDSYAVVPSVEGYMHHMLRVSGYKAHDDYAKQGNFQPMKMAPSCALVIDPESRSPAELIRPFWDLQTAADYLRFLRRRAA